MSTEREQLLQLLAKKSFRLGEFKLSSGGTSDYYIDCRLTTLDAEGARLTARVFYDLIMEQEWRPQAIGGMTMGADPIVVSVAMLSAQQIHGRKDDHASERPKRWYLDGFLVRKAGKEHGMGNRIEGFREKGARVVIVDDVCTTGSSTIQAIEAAREAGLDVVGVMCLVEREEAKGRPNVEKAAGSAPFLAVFTANDVRKAHIEWQEKMKSKKSIAEKVIGQQ